MKNINTILNVVLILAVAALFVLFFTDGDKKETDEPQAAEVSVSAVEGNIAYFDMDSVMAGWDLYYQYQQDLSQRQTELETDFAGRSEKYMQSVQDAQYKVERQLVTRAEAAQLEQNLAAEQQNLINLQQRYTAQLQEEGIVKNRQMLDMIERYVAEISAEAGYDFVFSYSFGGNLIYGAEPLDITPIIVAGLNQKYQPGTTELE